MDSDVSIRFADVSDAKMLLNIYEPYVLNTAITFECSVPSVEEFAERIENISKKYPYIVAEKDGEIVGYAYAGTFKNRAAYDYSVETTVYVKREYKQFGIGRKLYEKLEYLLVQLGICNMNACISFTEKENEYLTKGSVSFHEKMGFSMVGEFHNCGYKFGHWFSMVWMEKMIGNHDENMPPIKKISEISM